MSDKQIEIERAEFWSAVLDCDYNKYMKLKESHGELLGLVRAFNISNPLSVYRDKADAAIAKAERFEKTREGDKQAALADKAYKASEPNPLPANYVYDRETMAYRPANQKKT